MLKQIAVFASGNGTNFVALHQAIAARQLPATIALLVCDQPQAPVIAKARALQVPVLIVDFHDYANKAAAEEIILTALQARQIDAVLLAGYMRIIGATLLTAYPHKIINLHPALLPKFPGRHGIEDAFAAGVSETGVTIHYIDAGIDTGQIIAQRTVPVKSDDTLATLATRIHDCEHQFYPDVLQTLINEGAI
ncbi:MULTISPECIES: phosphoribosylglycinamide formyltransferase [Lactiplantibacillus]|jgi:phosphoribosylglycinamide formyltransferase-1|uniref:Phosphoribosylglycinamide formyltransferase n=1 Tax=Lactiplantibacillus pentosus TaxID=1589 RepID=A0ABD7IU58_LACPE|nr:MULTISPECIES: phosphoribosylglycinamide formyltransferase [Lactiplantibacillus]MCM8608519.1 phosphoribosylglycinamide formyltransferase [Lactiplantibacillus sp. B652]MCS8604766.1 phosphoribosylglycinamide formyltransferase [Lactiplantibacillus pentosus]MCT3284447.1 phosphoribosylglycinamide formyltransferase [Lactiplantibacillus pentosus]MCT3301549.1 phosphoribosylglycinamide formyltransferase [Lactiplantibacillus pentosus]PRO77138.1 phosphoribosylglycinamide formyltransferase [Lactiplantib